MRRAERRGGGPSDMVGWEAPYPTSVGEDMSPTRTGEGVLEQSLILLEALLLFFTCTSNYFYAYKQQGGTPSPWKINTIIVL